MNHDWIQEAAREFECSKCGVETELAPEPPEKAICPNCCESHNYVYINGERRHACEFCGAAPPDDWYSD